LAADPLFLLLNNLEMKNFLLPIFCFCMLGASAQTTKPKTAPKKTTPVATSKPASAIVLKNLNDSVSYAIGLSVAKFYSQQGIQNLNASLVSRAINDVMGKRKELLSEDQANNAVMRLLNPGLTKNVEEGEKFMEKNRKNPNVKTTASGIQYEVIKLGDGPRPTAEDTVEVNYAGTLLNGTEFDNSYKRGSSISFPLSNVIKGWTEALQLMPVGSKYKLYIPHNLAYGMNDNGPIPGGSLLIFEVDLIAIKGK
jgi:FKBP-type peptidyl-prolyl cis-trans isomerase